MTIDDVIAEFASATGFPQEAIEWSQQNWDEASPRFLDLLERYASGPDRSEEAGAAVFFALHLLGEKRERSAFAPLCRLLQDDDASEFLGDAVTETLSGLLISTFDGNAARLRTVIEAPDVNEFVRDAALSALAYLTRTGEIAEGDTRDYLMRLFETMLPRGPNMVWAGWVEAVARLGYQDWAGHAETLFRDEFVPLGFMDIEDFQDDLNRALADPDRMAGFTDNGIGPFTDMVEKLSGWSVSTNNDDDEDPWDDDLDDEMDLLDLPPIETYENPHRHVGRNDPCPCGSGKKYKKCCLVA